MKRLIKRWLQYKPLAETGPARQAMERNSIPDVRYFSPEWQGDFLFTLAEQSDCSRALEIGFASRSSALYMLLGMARTAGTLTSVDAYPEHYDHLGSRLIEAAGLSGRHTLIVGNSNPVLPELFGKGLRYQLAFLDGWKTFDHLAIDLYYTTRMLEPGGIIVFDDTRMPSVSKAIGLLLTHYAYQEVSYRNYGETPKLRLWRLASTRSFKRQFRAFRKVASEHELPISKDWTYWRSF